MDGIGGSNREAGEVEGKGENSGGRANTKS